MKAIIIRLSSAGDILLLSGAVKFLKKAGYETHLLVKKQFNSVAAETGADKILFWEDENARKYLQKVNYDVLCDMHSVIKSFFISLKIKARKKKSLRKDSLKRRMLVAFKWFKGGNSLIYDKYIETAAQAAGIRCDTDKKVFKRSFSGKKVLIHAGARWPLKRWPYMKELAVLLSKKGYKVTITGVKDEVEKESGLLYIKGKGIKNLIAKTDVGGLLSEIKKCDIFVGNDTMAAHAAALYNKAAFIFMGPTVSEFGFIDKERFNVIENKLACRPCSLHGKGECATGGFECMKGISPENALKEIIKIRREKR